MPGLYVHIPYCIRKCHYCDFLSAPGTEDEISRYLRVLEQEIKEKAVCFSGMEVDTVFLGGGTPSILSAEQIESLLGTIRSVFLISPEAEITIECNPRTADLVKLTAFRRAGINRISIGCQSAQKEELALLGRVHDMNDFLNCFSLARQAGFHNINVDLIYGIPSQTVESWKSTLHQICHLNPEHLSLYHLIIEEGTPFYEYYREEETARDAGNDPRFLPSEDVESEMEAATIRILASAGFSQYEISNYTKPGFECRHNIGYWTGKDYLGVGAGAASMCNDLSDEQARRLQLPEKGSWRFTNTRDIQAYTNGANNLAEMIRRSKVQREEEFMFLGLRMMRGVQKSDFYQSFSQTIDAVYGEEITELKKIGLIEETDGRIRLTPDGIRLGNIVFARFLQN